MKAKELIAKELCETRGVFSSLDGKKGKNYYNGVIIKELFTNNDVYNITGAEIEKLFDKIMSPELFGTDTELKLNKSLLRDRILRYKEYQSPFVVDEKVIKKSGTSIAKIRSHNITVDYHFMVRNSKTNTVEVYKVKNKKCNLKKGGRSKTTKIDESLELYLLQLAGQELYPSATVYGSLVYLPSANDSSGEVDGAFNVDKFINIVKYHFNDVDADRMDKRIIDTLDDSIPSIRNCTATDCNTCGLSNLCNYVHKDMSKLVVIPPKAKASGTVIFTEAQQKFIDIVKGIFRVLAGAGSGKTTVIANHYTQLIENRVNPADILLITYTNKGAIEMREKITYWLAQKGMSVPADKLNVFTFNSFGYELIKKEFKKFGFTKVPEVIDKLTKIDIIKDILEKHPRLSCLNYVNPFMSLFHANGAVIEIGEMFDTIKSQSLIYPAELQECYETKKLEDSEALEILKMSKEYNNFLKNNNLIEFADQILYAYKLLTDKAMLKLYGYSHVIVDEFQDTDSVQVNLLSLLVSYPFFISLCVCGDDSQSIYSWRGADQSNILNFHKHFKNVKDIEMVENFRSTDEICRVANNLDGINKFSTRKKLSSSRSGKTPILYKGDLDLISKNIASAIKKGFKPHQIAIITRTKSSLLDVQNYLDNLGIPSVIAISEQLIDNPKVKNIIGFSNFLVDNTLDLHLAEYLQVSKYDEFKNAKDIVSFVNKEKSVFLDEYNKHTNDYEKLQYVYEILEPIATEDKSVAKLIEICKSKGFATIKDLRNFLNKLEPYKADYYIEKSEEEYEAVTLTTAHSSKGREFDKVFVYLGKFKYPQPQSYLTDKNRPEVEEERRLLFVGITRAKIELDIIADSETSSIYKEVQACINVK